MPSRLSHLLLTTTSDPEAEGGVPCALRLALERHVERVSVFRPGPPLRRPLELLKQRLHGGAGRYPLWMTVPALKRTADEVRAEVARVRPEAVLSLGSAPVAYLERRELARPEALRIPIFLLADAPWLARRRAYERWQPMPAWTRRFADDEARAARQLDGLCFGSQWACDEALRLYSQSGTRRDLGLAERLHLTPLGATLTPQLNREELLALRRERATEETLELLFLCPEGERGWERGGGVIAVEMARQIRQSGRIIRLHIAGYEPKLPEPMIGPEGFVTIHGKDAATAELLLKAHFLLAPALAERSGSALAEAQAFALPVVARAVHAVPTIVGNGSSGILLPDGARASAYVERLLRLWDDREAYLAMTLRARERFEAELNWDRTVEAAVAPIEARIVQPSKAR